MSAPRRIATALAFVGGVLVANGARADPVLGRPGDDLPWDPDHGFSAKVFAGPAHERVLGAPIGGAEIGAYVGNIVGISGWYGGVDVLFGELSPGLFTFVLRPGATWEARIRRVRLGLGMDAAIVGVQRVTQSGTLQSAGLGGSAFVSVDLVRGERHALFLGARVHVDVLLGNDENGDAPILWGPTAQIGWRHR